MATALALESCGKENGELKSAIGFMASLRLAQSTRNPVSVNYEGERRCSSDSGVLAWHALGRSSVTRTVQSCDPSTQVQRQEEQKFEASLGYIRRRKQK